MLGLNTITLISSRVGSFIKRIVTDGLKMRLPFTSAKPLGENVVTNGDFATDSNWNLSNVTGGGASINTNDNTLVFTNGLGYVQSNDYILENGKTYIVKIDIESVSSGLIKVVAGADGSTYSPDYTAGGLYIHYFTPNTTHGKFEIYTGSSSTSAVINSVSVEEHAQETPDVSGNGNNAVLKTGKCLEFTGNDHININGFNVETNEATFAFWAKPASNPSSSSDMIIDLGIGNRFFISVAENRWKIYQYISGGSNFVLHDPKWNAIPNHWQRVVVSIDKNNYASVYRDGTLLTEPRLLPTPLDLSGKANGAIGCSYNKVDNFYTGYLSDIQVYDKAWSSDDVTYDYANPQNLVTDNLSTDIHLRNLKAWWHLSEGSGSVIHDSAPLVGAEDVVNGSFTTDSDWEKYGVTISDGKANFIGDGSSFTNINQDGVFTNGVVYKVIVDITIVSGQAKFQQWGINESIGWVNQTGVHTFYYTASGSTGLNIGRRHAGQVFEFYVNSVSVKEVFNANGEAKDGSALGASWEDGEAIIPQLGLMDWSKGSNLIPYSEDLHHWNAINGAVKSFDSSIVNPQGTIGSWKVAFDGTTNGRVERGIGGTTGLLTYSVWLKVDSGTATAQIGASTNGALVVTVTDEWQRFTHTQTYTSSTTYPRLRCDESGAEIYMWGAQHEYGSNASAYRKTQGSPVPVTNSTLIKTPDVQQFTGNKVTRNLIPYSEDMANEQGAGINSYATNSNATLEPNAAVSPVGTNKATKMSNPSGYAIFYNHINLDAGKTYTFSFHVKNINAAGLWYRVYNSTTQSDLIGATSYYSQTSTSEWVRVSVTFTTTSSGAYNLYLNSGVSNGNALFWGAQLQEGGLTRYFPTYGAIAQETLPIIGKDVLGNDVESRNGSLNLDGIGYAEVLDDNVFDIGINEAFSICGWARWKYVPQGVPGVFVSSLNTIYSNGNHLGNSNTFSVSVKKVAGNNKVSAFINTSEILSSIIYNEGDWFYFALTRREGGGNDTGKLYLSKIEQGDWVVVQDGNTISNNSAITNSTNKTIGWDMYGGDRKYHDLIDDIKFYDRELSLIEIQQNFNATKSAHTS